MSITRTSMYGARVTTYTRTISVNERVRQRARTRNEENSVIEN